MSDTPPEGYTEPVVIWVVEYVDPREPTGDSHQVGAFYSQPEAEKLRRRLGEEGFFAELRLNMLPVHHRIEDWIWDR